MGGGGDVGVAKNEAVVARPAAGLGSETGFVEHAVKHIARTVAGEHAAGAVRAVGARSQAEDQDACLRIAKRGYRLSPINPVPVGSPFDLGDAGDVVTQTGASAAPHNFVLKYLKQKVLFMLKYNQILLDAPRAHCAQSIVRLLRSNVRWV